MLYEKRKTISFIARKNSNPIRGFDASTFVQVNLFLRCFVLRRFTITPVDFKWGFLVSDRRIPHIELRQKAGDEILCSILGEHDGYCISVRLHRFRFTNKFY